MKRVLFFLPLICAALISTKSFAAEYRLQFHYQLDCSKLPADGFPGVMGRYEVDGRQFRVHLFKYNAEQSVEVYSDQPLTSDQVTVKWEEGMGCQVQNIQQALIEIPGENAERSIKDLARTHSPVLMSRKDQMRVIDRDVPFALGYTVSHADSGNLILRYTIFFSNETSSGFLATSKVKSLVQWGRRTDIEWIYEVEFNSNGRVVDRRYQGGIIKGFGHHTRRFKGSFLGGSEHPILCDIAKHNVFSDHGIVSEAVQFLAETEISTADAREEWMLRNPWSFDVSDRELARDKKLDVTSDGFLYVLIKGGEKKGMSIELTQVDGETRTSKLKSFLNHLGGSAAFTAVQLSENDFRAGGTLTLNPQVHSTKFSELKFFRLTTDPERGFKVHDVSSQIRCDEDLVCQF